MTRLSSKLCPRAARLAVIVSLCLPPASWGDDETIAKWKPNPSNNFYQTTTKMTKGAEVRIKVVSCPDGRANGIVLWHTNGARSTQLKRWDELAAGQILKTKLSDDIVISISTIPVLYAACKGVAHKGSFHQLTLETGGKTWVLDVKVVSTF
jgi:hypothetical protein